MGGMDYPGSNLNGLGGDVGAKQVESANPYTYSDSASQVKTKVKGLSFTANGTTVKMENMSEPFVIWLDGMKLIGLFKGWSTVLLKGGLQFVHCFCGTVFGKYLHKEMS